MQYDIKINDEGVITLIPQKSNPKAIVHISVNCGKDGGYARLVEFGKPASIRNEFFENDSLEGCRAKEITLTIRNK